MECLGTCTDSGGLQFRAAAPSGRQLPGGAGQLKTVVAQLVHGGYANGGRPQRTVVGLIRGTHPRVNRVGSAPDPVGGIRGVGIGAASGIVKGVVGQNIVVIFYAVASIVPVQCLPVFQMTHLYNSAGLGGGGGAGDFVVGADLPSAVCKGHAVFRFCVIGVGHPCTGGAVLRQHGAAPADLGKLAAGIGKLVYITGCVRNTGQPIGAAISKGGHSDGAAAVVLLHNFTDPIP